MVNTRVELPEEQLLHKRPWLLPVLIVASLVGALVALVLAGRTIPQVRAAVLRLAGRRRELELTAWTAWGLVAIFGGLEQIRRFDRRRRPLAPFLRVNRAVAYGLGATVGWVSLAIAGDGGRWLRLLDEGGEQARVSLVWAAASAALYVILVHPVRRVVSEDLEPFPVHIERQRETYDYTLGVRWPEDWEGAAKGRREWAVWPADGTYGNLLCLGQIVSGKTSQVADPLVLQALAKFPKDKSRQVSIVVLDLKGNQSVRYWEWSKAMGRADDFWVLRPDVVTTDSGAVPIPRERYVSFNALGGWDQTDLLAIEFQEALESTKDRPSPDYFRTVAQEFLIHALRVLTAATGTAPDLADVQAFGSSSETRSAMLESAAAEEHPGLEDSQRYFREEFGKLAPQDQASLLRGLAAQLTLLTNAAVQDSFCPKRSGGKRRELGGWHQEVLDRPGIVVFSCPPAKFTDGLSRLLGLLVLKSFQQAMLVRTDAGFAGNRTRPVILAVDEAHAFLNKRLGDFMSVSREAKVSSWLLTQSLSQIPKEYRGIVMSNTRTRVVLSVADETAQEMSRGLGEITELKEQLSYSESLQGAADHALREKKTGRSQGVSASRSYVEKIRPRWSPHAIQHLPAFRAVSHVFDGSRQAESELVATVPWYRLPFYVLDPLAHPNVRCPKGRLHEFAEAGDALRCALCGHELRAWAREDYVATRAAIERLAAAREGVTT
jgi:hypothetical protein